LNKNKKVLTKIKTADPEAYVEFKNCNKHNLKNIDVSIPYNRMTAITGVSGSGKSTLLLETIYPALKAITENKISYLKKQPQFVGGGTMIQRTVLIDQSPIGRTPRSNPATYTGVFTDIRDVFASMVDAKAQGFNAGRFSFNVKGGRCENCKGAGVIKVEMQFLADVYVKCDVCAGRRYNLETLSIKYRNKSINEVLDMTVDEATDFFTNHWKITRTLKILQSVGLGYIELGQSAPTLSGGEAQRVKLAKELYTNVNSHTIYLLDEPTTGLHMYDINKLVKVMRNLVEQGNTVVVIEHNLDIIKNSDYIIDLGKEGGAAGGEIIYQGKTEGLLKQEESDTSHYLREYLNEGY
jgi:excinuclease ABC subunit A